MTAIDSALDRLGRWLGRRITETKVQSWPYTPSDPTALRRALRPGDVLLVSGTEKVSRAIQYLTQSTWSHAAMYVDDIAGQQTDEGEVHCLIEVNVGEGCVTAPLSKYARHHVRVCRPVALTDADRKTVTDFMISKVGLKYDMRNIIDLVRYLIPGPPVPMRWRRRMLSLGSGEPTRAICSTLIAQAFAKVRYPILPRIEKVTSEKLGISREVRKEILHIRHHSLFTPSDFDLSPYFRIIKPTIEEGFNYKGLVWGTQTHAADAGSSNASNTSRLHDDQAAAGTPSDGQSSARKDAK